MSLVPLVLGASPFRSLHRIARAARPITVTSIGICVSTTLLCTGQAFAANGFVQPGNSAAELGMAGAGTALTDSPAAILRNPAAGAWMESGLSLVLGLARPEGRFQSGPTGQNSLFGVLEIDPVATENVQGIFPIPALSYNRRVDDDRAWGLGIRFAGLQSRTNAGSATLARGFPTFATRCEGPFGGGVPLAGRADTRRLCGRAGPKGGAEFAQLMLSAHFSQRIGSELSVGIAPILVGQRLVIRGLSAFRPYSVNPAATSDEGAEWSWGGAMQIGAIWEPHPDLRLAATLQSQTLTQPFAHYEGVIIGGRLDAPPVLDLGVGLTLSPQHRLLLDYQRVWHSQVPSLAMRLDTDRITNGCLLPRLLDELALAATVARDDQTCLGGDAGPGFGLRNLSVYKIGYQWNRGRLALRAGLSWTQAPLGDEQIVVAVFAPAITRRHEAIGLSWALTPRLGLDAALIHAVQERLSAPNSLSSVNARIGISPLLRFETEADDADQRINVALEVWQFHIGLNWRFGRDQE